jgi:hypothetical protein
MIDLALEVSAWLLDDSGFVISSRCKMSVLGSVQLSRLPRFLVNRSFHGDVHEKVKVSLCINVRLESSSRGQLAFCNYDDTSFFVGFVRLPIKSACGRAHSCFQSLLGFEIDYATRKHRQGFQLFS